MKENENEKSRKPPDWPNAMWKPWEKINSKFNGTTAYKSSTELLFLKYKKIPMRNARFVLFNAQLTYFYDKMAALEILIQNFHGTCHKKNFQERHFQWYSILISVTFFWKLWLLITPPSCWQVDSWETYCSLFLLLFTGLFCWILLLDSFSCSKVLIFTPCFRDRIESQSNCNLVSLR